MNSLIRIWGIKIRVGIKTQIIGEQRHATTGLPGCLKDASCVSVTLCVQGVFINRGSRHGVHSTFNAT